MFSFTKFFNGKKVSSVENIDHDQLTEMFFETLPQLKDDARWTISIKRRVPGVLLLLVLMLGCTTTRPEAVNDMNLEQQLQAYIDDYYDQVVGLCVEIHGKAQMGTSPVDCAVKYREMHLSFPNKAYHDDPRRFDDIGRLYQHWCAASGSKFGRHGTWVRHFRREGVVQSVPCNAKKGPSWPMERQPSN